MLGLAVAAAIGWGVCELAVRRGPGMLAGALVGAFDRARLPSFDPAAAMLAFAGLLALLLLASSLRGRWVSPRALGVSETLGEIPAAPALLACVLALVAILACLRPSLAASARAVDADGLGGLWPLWWVWLQRGLAGLAAITLGIGMLERLVSARMLWHGLHLTREQARERARASGEGRRRGGQPGSA